MDAARRAEHAAEDAAYRGFSKGVAGAGAAEEGTGKVGGWVGGWAGGVSLCLRCMGVCWAHVNVMQLGKVAWEGCHS